MDNNRLAGGLLTAALARLWEPFTALGVGTVLNLTVSLSAYAGVLPAPALDPQWLAAAGAAGGLVSALVHVGVVCLGAEPPTREEITRALIEGLFAIIVGALFAGYLGPLTARLLPAAGSADLRAVSFGVGMLAWRVAPGFFGAAKLLSNPATLRDMAINWLGGRIGK